MRRLISAVFVVGVLVLSLLLATTAVVSAGPGPQTWQLDSEQISTGIYQMEKTGGPGDDNQSGSVNITPGTSLLWISDEAAVTDVTFSGGAWKIELATNSKWGSSGDKCGVGVGEWDGTEFTAFSLIEIASVNWTQSGNEYIFKLELQTYSAIVHVNNYLAVRITNNDSTAHTIYTGEGFYASCVTSPQTDPGYPLPEIAAGILLGGGLLGLGGYITVRRKRAKAASLRDT